MFFFPDPIPRLPMPRYLAKALSFPNRLVNLPLFGARFSKRGSGASSSAFRLGRAARWRRRHSFVLSRTASSLPLRVMICGPTRAAFNSLLNSALACFADQVITSLPLHLNFGKSRIFVQWKRMTAHDAQLLHSVADFTAAAPTPPLAHSTVESPCESQSMHAAPLNPRGP